MSNQPNSFLIPQTKAACCAGSRVAALIQMVAGAALLAAGSQVRIGIPGHVVPMTLQSLALLMIGMNFSPARAVGAVIIYLGAGAAGLPVFSAALVATGGFLFGFLPAAWSVSMARGRSLSFIRLMIAGFVGLIVLFTLGVGWLLLNTSLVFAIKQGLLPFVGKALVELTLAAMMTTSINRLRRRAKS